MEKARDSAVLCGSNGLPGNGVGIFRIGTHRIDSLGRDNERMVSLPVGILYRMCLDLGIFVTSVDE
jgi:hypothetical protein